MKFRYILGNAQPFVSYGFHFTTSPSTSTTIPSCQSNFLDTLYSTRCCTSSNPFLAGDIPDLSTPGSSPLSLSVNRKSIFYSCLRVKLPLYAPCSQAARCQQPDGHKADAAVGPICTCLPWPSTLILIIQDRPQASQGLPINRLHYMDPYVRIYFLIRRSSSASPQFEPQSLPFIRALSIIHRS